METYSFAMMIMMITMALAQNQKEPVGIRIKDASAVIAFGNPPDIRIRRAPDPKVKTKSTLMVEAQMIKITGPKGKDNKPMRTAIGIHGDLMLNGKSLDKSMAMINKRLIQIAATVNDIATKTKIKDIKQLPVAEWSKEMSGGNSGKPSSDGCAKLSVSQCKTTKMACSWDDGKCMMKKPDGCAKLGASDCEKTKLPCSWDKGKCMMKKPADGCAKLGASDCEKTKLPCSWEGARDSGKCIMKKKPADGKGKTTPKKGGPQKGKTTPKKGGGADCKKFGASKCGKDAASKSCSWDGGECKPKKGGQKLGGR